MKMQIEGTTYYDIPELVKTLGVNKKTLYRWIEQKKIKAHHLGKRYLVSGHELKRFIESR